VATDSVQSSTNSKNQNSKKSTSTNDLELSREILSDQNSSILIDTLDNFQDGFFALDTNWNFVYINKRAASIVSLEPDNIIGANIWDAFPQIKNTILEEKYRYAMQTQQVVNFETKGIGGEVWFSITVYPSKNGILVNWRDITEHKQFEDTLKENEARFRSLFENSLDAVFLTYPDGTIISANPAAENMFKMSEEELKKIGRNGIMVLDKKAQAILEERERTGKMHAEFTYKRKDGTTFEGDATSTIFTAADGTKKTNVIIRDITGRKKIEQELREKEQLYRTVFENSEDAFQLIELSYDANGKSVNQRVLKVNKAFTEQTGIKEADIVGKTAKEVNPKVNSCWFTVPEKVLKTGKSIHIERYDRNTQRYYDVYYFPYSDNIIGLLFRDITDRKKIEAALVHSSQRINEILESIFDDFMVLDQNWNYVYANSQAAKLVGLDPKDIVGKNFWQLFPQNKGTYIEKNLREAMNNREIRRFEIHGQYSGKYKLITTYPSVDGITLIATDITERKQLEKKLQEKERMAAIGETAGMVGHDLRNPLQTIVSELYLAENELKYMPEGQKKTNMVEAIHNISEQVGYMDKIVSDLQTFVKPVLPHMKTVKLKPLIVALLIQANIPTNIITNSSIPEELTVNADPQLLKRVLINLTTNAIQAMPQGGELTIKAYLDNPKQVQITVEDTGVGIAELHLL